MTTLDLHHLEQILTDLRHATGDRRDELLADLHQLLDLGDVLGLLLAVRTLLPRLEWAGVGSGLGTHVAACPSCGMPRVAGHTESCPLARTLGRVR